jgi:hypothetical protein
MDIKLFHANKKKARRSAGLCLRCPSPRDENSIHCSPCRFKAYEKQKRWRDKIKKIVSDYYGEICVCCGEKESSMLTMDHALNIGKDRRKEGNINLFLIKNNFPSGYSVMCHNCNISKYRLGICAHLQKGLSPFVPYPIEKVKPIVKIKRINRVDNSWIKDI